MRVEFELFVTPLCTCAVNSELVVLTRDGVGKERKATLIFAFETQISTSIRYEEAVEGDNVRAWRFGMSTAACSAGT